MFFVQQLYQNSLITKLNQRVILTEQALTTNRNRSVNPRDYQAIKQEEIADDRVTLIRNHTDRHAAAMA